LGKAATFLGMGDEGKSGDNGFNFGDIAKLGPGGKASYYPNNQVKEVQNGTNPVTSKYPAKTEYGDNIRTDGTVHVPKSVNGLGSVDAMESNMNLDNYAYDTNYVKISEDGDEVVYQYVGNGITEVVPAATIQRILNNIPSLRTVTTTNRCAFQIDGGTLVNPAPGQVRIETIQNNGVNILLQNSKTFVEHLSKFLNTGVYNTGVLYPVSVVFGNTTDGTNGTSLVCILQDGSVVDLFNFNATNLPQIARFEIRVNISNTLLIEQAVIILSHEFMIHAVGNAEVLRLFNTGRLDFTTLLTAYNALIQANSSNTNGFGSLSHQQVTDNNSLYSVVVTEVLTSLTIGNDVRKMYYRERPDSTSRFPKYYKLRTSIGTQTIGSPQGLGSSFIYASLHERLVTQANYSRDIYRQQTLSALQQDTYFQYFIDIRNCDNQ
jgi:hypothetical protein